MRVLRDTQFVSRGDGILSRNFRLRPEVVHTYAERKQTEIAKGNLNKNEENPTSGGFSSLIPMDFAQRKGRGTM